LIRKTQPLYKATFAVVPAGAGRTFDHEVVLTAKGFEAARRQAQPTVGYYSFELVRLERIGSIAVTW
jgi:hypothetical protein